MKYDSLRKTERNREIRAFARSHTRWSQAEIAARFGVSRPTISRILAIKRMRDDTPWRGGRV